MTHGFDAGILDTRAKLETDAVGHVFVQGVGPQSHSANPVNSAPNASPLHVIQGIDPLLTSQT